MYLIEARTADGAWREGLERLRGQTTPRENGSKGNSREILHAAISISEPRQRWVLSRRPAINPAFAIAEVVWIMMGRSDSQFLINWNRSIRKFAGDADNFFGAYGARLRSRFGVDQLERAANVLSAAPQQRQVVLQIWDARSDLPASNGSSQDDDIPCNVMAMLKLSDGKLEWMQVMRSNDVILGLPYNFIQWTCIQEILAGWIGAEVGTYNHVADSLHLYDRDAAAYTATAASEVTENTDDLRLPRDESDKTFRSLEASIETLAAATCPGEVLEVLSSSDLNESYKNLLRVVCAEKLRKLGSPDARRIEGQISSPMLRQASANWRGKFGA